jgi:hypothetical protein
MAKISRQVGTSSQLVDLFALNSASTTGAGLAGLTFNSSGLTCFYHRNTAAASVAVTLANMTLGTYSTGGFIAVDGANMPGLYQFGIPNAALASGADTVTFAFAGATNLAPLYLEIELTAVNNQATSFGLSLAKTTNITGFNDIAAAAVWSTTVPGGFGAGTAGSALALAASYGPKINNPIANFPFQMLNASGQAATGLAINSTSACDGAAPVPTTNSAREQGGGWYLIDLSAADMNGQAVTLTFAASGAQTLSIVFLTQP